jgi:Lar family restriction alleviation protein
MTEKLLPCPFCGGEASVRTVLRVLARCEMCGSEGQSFSMVDAGVEAASDQAIAAWNRRTPAPEGEVVAWRYRYPNDPTWHLTASYQQAHDKTYEVEALAPLPAAPTPADGGGE